MSRRTGGPAFPGLPEGWDPETGTVRAYGGMSLHDYAAIKILTAMITSSPVTDRTTVDKRAWSKLSLDWADAWLEERNNHQSKG